MFGFNPAVIALLGNRTTALASGAVTSIFIGVFFSPEIQGYHYAFLTLIAMANLAEFGFAGATQQFAAHEWAFLQLDSKRFVSGDERSLDRLSHIIKFTVVWAVVAGFALGLMLLVVGYLMFSARVDNVAWKLPWLILVVAAGIDFAASLILAALEGCDQVAEVNMIRLVRLAGYSAVMWSVMATGGGLFAAPLGMVSATFLVSIAIVIRWRRFFLQLLRRLVTEGINWRKEFLPLQFKFGMSSLANYLAFSLLVPIVFSLEGPVRAGQFGLTWFAVQGIITLSGSWFIANVPKYGELVVTKNRAELDRLAIRSTVKSVVTIVLFGTMFMGLLWGLEVYFESLSSRFLSLHASGALLLGGIPRLVIWSASVYARSHKQEPLLKLALVAGPFLISVFWIAALTRTVSEAVVWYTVASVFVVIPVAGAMFVRFYRSQTPDGDWNR